jgi:hypothetical protein
MAKGNGEKPARKGTKDPLLEELQQAASRPTPPPTEVPPRDTDKADSGISAESIKSEREEDALIDKNIEARRAAEVAAAPEAVSSELEHLSPEERKTYEKIPAEKRESYLAHVAEVRADKEKKEKASKNKKPVKPRAQKSKVQAPEKIKEMTRRMKEETAEELKQMATARAAVLKPSGAAPDAPTIKISVEATSTPNPDEDEEYPAVFRYNRDRRGNDEAIVVPSPVELEQHENVSPKTEGTPKEWRKKLRGLIEGAKEKIGMSERGESMKAYLAERSKALGEKVKEYGANPEKLIRDMGEQYNKLSFKQKLLFGFGLGAGATIFAGVSTPLTLLFAGGLGIQRAGGMASMYLKFEKHLQDTVEGKSKGILGRQEWYQNIFMGSSEKQRKVMAALMSVGYTAGMSAAIGGTIKLASESQYGEAVHDWLRHHYPFGEAGASLTGASATDAAPTPVPTESGMGAEAPHTAAAATAPEHSAIPAGHQASADVQYQAMRAVETGHQASADVQAAALRTAESNVATVIPEMPTVGASSGHGYEYMMKRMWEQLHSQNIDASKFDANSDVHKLLTADANSIDKIVHQIAADPKHGFFHADGTSVRIDPSAHMTIGAHGELHLADAGHDYTFAPAHAPVAPVHHLEASVSHVAAAPITPIETVTAQTVPVPEVVTPPSGAEAYAPPPHQPPPPIAPPIEHAPVYEPAPAAPIEKNIPFVSPPETHVAVPEVQSLQSETIVTPDATVEKVDITNNPEFVSGPHVETPPVSAVVEQATIISNQFGLKIPVAEPHIYAGADSGQTFVYGGTSVERSKAVLEYLKGNPNKVVFAADDTAKFRLVWHLQDGNAVISKAPMRTNGFFGFFSTWMKPPEPDEFQKIIK